MDVTEQNITSPDNLDIRHLHLECKLLAFDAQHGWMATVEMRDDQVTSIEIKLKFWNYSKAGLVLFSIK